jgi:ornithine cyclodeaminase/alanine dehydrogenase-like protein (mu-crystallin family)
LQGESNRFRIVQNFSVEDDKSSIHFVAVTPGKLLAGKTSFERQADDVTVFDMTGIALQDLTLVQRLRQRALVSGAGTGSRAD